MPRRRPHVTWRWNARSVWQLQLWSSGRDLVAIRGALGLSWACQAPANDRLPWGRQ